MTERLNWTELTFSFGLEPSLLWLLLPWHFWRLQSRFFVRCSLVWVNLMGCFFVVVVVLDSGLHLWQKWKSIILTAFFDFVLAMPHGLWNPSSSTRNWPLSVKEWSPNHWTTRNSLTASYLNDGAWFWFIAVSVLFSLVTWLSWWLPHFSTQLFPFLFVIRYLLTSTLQLCKDSISSVQFRSVTQFCPTVCDPMDCSTPVFPVYHQFPELTQTHVHPVSDAIQISHPLSSPSPPAFNLSQLQGLFKWVSSSRQMAKVFELQLQHQYFQWIFRTDFL